jgi:hypothetical protein
MTMRPCGHEDWSPGLPCPEPECWSGGPVLRMARAPRILPDGTVLGAVTERYEMRRGTLNGATVYAWDGPLP